MPQRILILCTGNSCRSQMAAAFMKSFDRNLEVYSAGTNPAARVSSRAIQVMNETGIDISSERPKSVDQFLGESFDYVITVCDNAKETCPVFIGNVSNRLHIGFDDPAEPGTIRRSACSFSACAGRNQRAFFQMVSGHIVNISRIEYGFNQSKMRLR